MAWRHTFHILSLILKPANLGLSQFALVLSKIERWLTDGTLTFHLLKLMPFIFMPEIMSNLYQLAKNSFINRNCQNRISSSSTRDFWHLAKNISSNFTFSSFPPLFYPDGTTAVSSIPKAEIFAQTFAKISTLYLYFKFPFWPVYCYCGKWSLFFS